MLTLPETAVMDLRRSSSRGKMNGSGGVWRHINGVWTICEHVVNSKAFQASLKAKATQSEWFTECLSRKGQAFL
jgi:hypothetical protein